MELDFIRRQQREKVWRERKEQRQKDRQSQSRSRNTSSTSSEIPRMSAPPRKKLNHDLEISSSSDHHTEQQDVHLTNNSTRTSCSRIRKKRTRAPPPPPDDDDDGRIRDTHNNHDHSNSNDKPPLIPNKASAGSSSKKREASSSGTTTHHHSKEVEEKEKEEHSSWSSTPRHLTTKHKHNKQNYQHKKYKPNKNHSKQHHHHDTKSSLNNSSATTTTHHHDDTDDTTTTTTDGDTNNNTYYSGKRRHVRNRNEIQKRSCNDNNNNNNNDDDDQLRLRKERIAKLKQKEKLERGLQMIENLYGPIQEANEQQQDQQHSKHGDDHHVKPPSSPLTEARGSNDRINNSILPNSPIHNKKKKRQEERREYTTTTMKYTINDSSSVQHCSQSTYNTNVTYNTNESSKRQQQEQQEKEKQPKFQRYNSHTSGTSTMSPLTQSPSSLDGGTTSKSQSQQSSHHPPPSLSLLSSSSPLQKKTTTTTSTSNTIGDGVGGVTGLTTIKRNNYQRSSPDKKQRLDYDHHTYSYKPSTTTTTTSLLLLSSPTIGPTTTTTITSPSVYNKISSSSTTTMGMNSNHSSPQRILFPSNNNNNTTTTTDTTNRDEEEEKEEESNENLSLVELAAKLKLKRERLAREQAGQQQQQQQHQHQSQQQNQHHQQQLHEEEDDEYQQHKQNYPQQRHQRQDLEDEEQQQQEKGELMKEEECIKRGPSTTTTTTTTTPSSSSSLRYLGIRYMQDKNLAKTICNNNNTSLGRKKQRQEVLVDNQESLWNDSDDDDEQKNTKSNNNNDEKMEQKSKRNRQHSSSLTTNDDTSKKPKESNYYLHDEDDDDDEDEDKEESESELERQLKPDFLFPKLGPPGKLEPFPLLRSSHHDNDDEEDDEIEDSDDNNDDDDKGHNVKGEGLARPQQQHQGQKDQQCQVPASINRYLQDYQRDGIAFLYSLVSRKKGAILGDDMGLGKTIQLISLLAALQKKTGTKKDWKELKDREKLITEEMKVEREKLDNDVLFGTTTTTATTTTNIDQSKLQIEAAKKFCPCLIVCPPSIVENWSNEFNVWGHFGVSVFKDKNRANAIERIEKGIDDVMICGRSLFAKRDSPIHSIGWKLVVVDEFHEYRNNKSQAYTYLSDLLNVCHCPLVGMTGTLMSNQHNDIYYLTDLVQPNLLGEWKEFKAHISEPLKRSRIKDAKPEIVELGRKREAEMKKLMEKVYIKRDKSVVLKDSLKNKDETVMFCELSDVQKRIYQRILSLPDYQYLIKANSPCDCGVNKEFFQKYQALKTSKERIDYNRRFKEKVQRRKDCCFAEPYDPILGKPNIDPKAVMWKSVQTGDKKRSPTSILLIALSKLYKVASHASLLQLDEEPGPTIDKRTQSALDFAKVALTPDILEELPGKSYVRGDSIMDDHLKVSGKMVSLDILLNEYNQCGDRVLVFSYSTRTLDMIQHYVRGKGYSYLRLDGSTPTSKRQSLIDKFQQDNSFFLFLISTKAGGLGLNLTAANRVVVFDVNWNPSHDEQAQDRAFRIGQERDVDVVRLVSQGTIEEQMYLRQVYKVHLKKQTLGGNEGNVGAQPARIFRGVHKDPNRKGELFGQENLLKFKDGSFMMDLWKKSDGQTAKQTHRVSDMVSKLLSDEAKKLLGADEGDADDLPFGSIPSEAHPVLPEKKTKSVAIRHEDFLRDDRGDAALKLGDQGFEEELGGQSQVMQITCEQACKGIEADSIPQVESTPQQAEEVKTTTNEKKVKIASRPPTKTKATGEKKTKKAPRTLTSTVKKRGKFSPSLLHIPSYLKR